MKFIADLHIHSLFSRATSKASNLAGLFAWARVKGIQVVGTGDFTHPGWFSQLKELLVPAEPGLFRLRDENVPPALDQIKTEPGPVRFLLTSEISNIYKRHDKVRKVHNLLFAPDFASVERINSRLAAIGNIESDGRPILGLDSRNLLEILLEECPEGFLVPAHIWTPWFSLFGSRSGFDAIEECYGDLTSHIFALETGLSSDPDMNRLVSALDPFTLISNSDCHSPGKLGREANLFDTDLDFFSIREALKDHSQGFMGTIEFYSEEGKYHLDGHRKCQVCLEPLETRKIQAVCPVCGRPLTVGVSSRVYDLADREKPYYPSGSPLFHSLIPLPEVLGEIAGYGPNSKTVLREYGRVISHFGSEFTLLLHTPLAEIDLFSPVLAEAVKRMRLNQVIKKPGFDGEFGVIHVFEEGEIDEFSGQLSLFGGKKRKKKKRAAKMAPPPAPSPASPTKPVVKKTRLNPEQQAAINSEEKKILVSAGPGTGKTFTLVARISRLLEECPPDQMIVITFTNKAADEIRERLLKKCGAKAKQLFIGTFHTFCLEWLRKREPNLTVIGADNQDLLLGRLFPESSQKDLKDLKKEILAHWTNLYDPKSDQDVTNPAISAYLKEIEQQKGIDLDIIIPSFVHLLQTDTDLAEHVKSQVSYLFVDEFQDLNQAQYDLVDFLAQSSHVFAIGDPDQAIYGFRGSDLRFFFSFSAKECQSLTLNRNYRSAPILLQAAGKLIRYNSKHSEISLLPQLDMKGHISHYQAATPQAEAEFMVKSIEKIMGGISNFSLNSDRGGEGMSEKSFSDIAVLFRLSRQARPLAVALSRRGIPYQLVGSTPFFMETDIRPIYYLLQTAVGKAAPADFIGLLKKMAGIGPVSIKKIERNLPLISPDFLDHIADGSLSGKAIKSIDEIKKLCEQFKVKEADSSVVPCLQAAMTLLKIDADSPNSRRLLELAMIFPTVAHFASHLRKNRDATIYDDQAEGVALMTLHAAKGLEFPVVFIPGLEEGITPYLSFDSTDIEEERRLFYVGMTRAREILILTSAPGRQAGKTSGKISRFIREIPARYIETLCQKVKKKDPKAIQLNLF